MFEVVVLLLYDVLDVDHHQLLALSKPHDIVVAVRDAHHGYLLLLSKYHVVDARQQLQIHLRGDGGLAAPQLARSPWEVPGEVPGEVPSPMTPSNQTRKLPVY